ncbi:MAG: hypothetical protein DRI36_01055 [Caldiserica bacterium]|nr:MAG: hypothetical protein DRI36_01055 [Caldisericota bacterium]
MAVIGSDDFSFPFEFIGFKRIGEDEIDKLNSVTFLVVEREFYESKKEIFDEFEKKVESVLVVLPGIKEDFKKNLEEIKNLTITATGVNLWKKE